MTVYKLLHKNHFLCLTLGIVTILLLCGLPASASNSEWTAIGLQGRAVEALAINPTTPDTLYVAVVSDGVFKTTNGGSNWVRANTSITNTQVRALAINPTISATLYAGTYGGGVFKSINGGSNWTPVNAGLTKLKVRALAINPTAPSGSIVINSGAAYATSASVNLTLSASDSGSGVYQMRFSNDGSTWSAWEAYATSKAWSLTSGDGTKTVYVQYQDNVGYTSSSFSDTIILDTVAPSGSIVINGGAAYATSTAVNLTLSASDSRSGVYQMRFSNNGSTWSAWEAYGTSKAWTLTSGDGAKTVYVQYSDNAGNVSASYSDTIILDTVAPTSSATSPITTSALSFSVTWSGSDSLSGVASYDVQYRVGSGGTWTDWLASTMATSAIFGPTTPVTVQDRQTCYFQVRARDNAGNVEVYPGGNGDTSTLVQQYNIFLPSVIRN